MRKGRLAPFLAITSITVAEFVTGSTPLTKIFTDPSSFFLFNLPALFGIYGCGVVLIREAAVVWNKGWGSILLMGIAYGILEEGVGTHTFFAPVDNTVGPLGSYGRYMGIDVTWAISISLFHAVFSIALPILFSRILWPEMKRERVLRRRSVITLFVLYLTTILILNYIAPYRPDLSYLILLFIAAGLIVVVSRFLPGTSYRPNRKPVHHGNVKMLSLGLLIFPFIVLLPRMQLISPPFLVDIELIAGAIILYSYLSSRLESVLNLAFFAVGATIPLMVFGAIVAVEENILGFAAILALCYLELKMVRYSRGVEKRITILQD